MFEASPIPLRDLRAAYASLLESGLPIRDVNEVRKGLSKVKGGRLAARAAGRGATVLGLIVSDIVGDPIQDIGSGPTAVDSSRGTRAIEILRTGGLWDKMPGTVRALLETVRTEPKPRRTARGRVHNRIIADVTRACTAAVDEAVRRGYSTHLLSTSLEGEARKVGRAFAAQALRWSSRSPAIGVVAGGETTVRVAAVRWDGCGSRGGRSWSCSEDRRAANHVHRRPERACWDSNPGQRLRRPLSYPS